MTVSQKTCFLLLVFAGWLLPGMSAAADTAVVRTAEFGAIAVYPQHAAPAIVLSDNASAISAEVAARVLELPARVGDIVEAGAVIARLDCRDYELELRAARAARDVVNARLELATRRLRRAEELRARNSLAVETLDERSAERAVLAAELDSAAVRIAAARVAIERCVVTSPFRALVRQRMTPVGQFAAVGDPIVHVVDVANLELSAQVLAADIDALNGDNPLRFIAGTKRYPVALRRAVAAVDSETRNREVRFGFPAERPLVGTAGQLVWADQRPHVPGNYLVRRSAGYGLFVAADGRARFVPLPAAQAGRAAAVTLDTDVEVVIEGHYGLEDGQAIRLQDEQ